MVVIERPDDLGRLSGTKKWLLVYGRRKTGKTFLIENFMKYDEYFFVRRDGGLISKVGEKTIAYDTFTEILKRALADDKTVVVDEFHRLGGEFFDLLHYMKKQGRLILVSSTLYLSRQMFSSHSPLLGLFAETPITLISLKDTLKAAEKLTNDNKQRLELAKLLREPLSVEYLDPKKDPRKILADILSSSAQTIPALVGEIFTEEERHTSAVYEGILRAVADGRVVSGEISSQLFSKKLIKKDDPSVIQQYLANLIRFGILRRIEVFGKKRYIYKHVSPLARLYYYADEKYNISERRPSDAEMQRIIDNIMPRLVEDNIREYLAEKHNLKETVIEAADYEVDACLLRFQKPEIAVEVKWKQQITPKDLQEAEDKLQKTEAKTRILFVQDKKNIPPTKLQINDPIDL